ncbi:uncharacterized protein LOC122068900 [Macadamia integrifolia]|uniref:uncharacterized protein LOC122068900 n=1 Tax=Macadamia integrifolia TaxID=60698 RepID=UPI001C4E3B83|nr:uncharacterized protein LOC122068900 [Macadamia integrifolia]
MRFLRRIAGIFGLLKDDAHDAHDEDDDADEHHNRENKAETRRPTKGFSVKAPVPVDRAYLGPVLTPCDLSDGGVQGMRWFAKRLRIDEDGDVADEFLNEVLPEVPSGMVDEHKPLPLPKFEVKYNARPAKVRNQFIAIDGRINQSVEFQGRLLLV